MGRNDRTVLSLLAIVLCGMLWIGWQVQSLVPLKEQSPMTRTTEWATPQGMVEQIQSVSRSGETFAEFRHRHDFAVKELTGE